MLKAETGAFSGFSRYPERERPETIFKGVNQ